MLVAILAVGATACSSKDDEKSSSGPTTTNPFGNIVFAEPAGGGVPATSEQEAQGFVAGDKEAALTMLQNAGIENLGSSVDQVDFNTAFLVLAVGKTVMGEEVHGQAIQALKKGDELNVRLDVHKMGNPASKELKNPYALMLVQRSSVETLPKSVKVTG